MKKSICKLALMATLASGLPSAWGESNRGGGNDFTKPHLAGAHEKQPSWRPATNTQKRNSKNTLILKGLDGKTHNLKEWKGQVVLLNFWASWCAPCLYEIRDFVAYQGKYEKRGLVIIGVGLDDEEKLRNVERSLEINYPILIADLKKDRGLMESWGNASGIVPYTVLLNRDGEVMYSQHGQLSQEEFEENVLPVLGN